MNFSSRVRGCLMAGALGDSFGSAVEPGIGHSFGPDFGAIGLLDLSQLPQPVHFSEKTQLSLFTVDALVEAIDWANQGVAADHIACLWLSYLRWLRSQGEAIPEGAPQPPGRWIDRQQVLSHRRKPDRSCLSSLLSGEMGTLAKPVSPEANGCGSLTRSAPFGLIPYLEAGTVAKMSMEGAALTHGHPTAIQASAAFSWLIHQLAVQELGLIEAAESMQSYLTDLRADPELLTRLEQAVQEPGEQFRDERDEAASNRGESAADILALALSSVLSTASTSPSPKAHYLAAIRTASRLQGKSASLVGNILGAHYGESCLPESWLQMSEAPELIYAMAESLLTVTGDRVARPDSSVG
ncbi:ADP-ribosylglycohydrolase [Psychromicrobium silvestre]|uniref:ADP-ribosylglycohydrolase n=1 Tax=Psychromicrobium silvestre TaxID=1645614 RepID=A0A7Y9S7P2_9MICC|nr:ADP-ribosylglycohydrolase family protein [Psychromicrobium silvestre]NYE94762.1 ADP-ribosylglycohydrolase [Psychromicrobium silvestre]